MTVLSLERGGAGRRMDDEYWSLEEGSCTVTFAETDACLEACRAVAEAAVCCALDAEWPPEIRENPQASLVQLALWSPGHGMHVVMLDMLALPKAAVKQWLQALFRNKHTLKVGYSLVLDLRAVAASLGGEGGSCIAVVEPAMDVGTLHRFLLKHRAPGVHRATLPGLSGIIEAQVGLPLDKRQQCSAWGHRPLSPDQLRYAAADAACLLALLDDLVRKARPEEFPMGCGEEGLRAGAPLPGPSSRGGVEAAADDFVEGGSAGEEEQAEEEPEESLAAGSGAACGGSEDMVVSSGPLTNATGCSGTASSTGSGSMAGEGAQGSRWMACGVTRLQVAAEWWGSRLELSGGKAVKQRLARRGKARLRKAKEEDIMCDFPAHVPWMDSRRRVTGSPRFLCDVMAEGLARQLRLVGCDAESLPPRDKTQRHAMYRSLVERAEDEGRVVLTRDQTFMVAGYTHQAYLVRAATKQQQLQEVMRVFGLKVGEEDLLSRCAKCNGEFIPEPLGPEELPQGHGVPEGIRQQHREFWVCARCSTCYWQGNQFGHAIERLSGMLASMAVQ